VSTDATTKCSKKSLTQISFVSVFLSHTLPPQEDQLEILKQQAKEELQKQFEEEMQQMIAKRNQEAAEHKKQLESVKREMETQKQRMDMVCTLCVAIMVASL